MFVTSKGIVVHRTKYSDTSLIVNIFTEKFGLRSFMVKGAFAKKSKFRYTLFSPLAMLEVTFDLRNSDILFLKDVRLHYHFTRIPLDVVRNSILMFYNELIYKTIFQHHEDQALFLYVEKKILELDEEVVATADVHIRFILGLLQVLGVGIANNYSETNCYFFLQESAFQSQYFDHDEILSQQSSAYLSQLLTDKNTNIQADKSIRLELLRFLLRYMTYHIPGFKMSDSLQILADILN
ncbi:DNA repair protein RecO [Bacteroidales bacterium OttesenSCG-928-B11]|nr:DNA repair protein RecO [Bacteroidales bacterium OttesenSCG-928-E04]MDL2308226.1 DNA repair protein RecO [Bacteroidales bacterium OttesenSCG-928-C03]MDL2311526.1 DNA repair protein RecO [Bacteroidales bacterium OttesenSCG-928-B11]MDL2325665.1 DNA repair protein RecO [Bacteroidales bacterium OttesenSCG-928-A14]